MQDSQGACSGTQLPKTPSAPDRGADTVQTCRPCTTVPSFHRSPSSVPQAAKDEAGQEIFTFSNRINLSASYGAALLSCLAHLRVHQPPLCFSCPHRTPAPNPILKHFEGNFCACKQAGAIPSRSHALVLVSSDVANKKGNRIIFTTEDYFMY